MGVVPFVFGVVDFEGAVGRYALGVSSRLTKESVPTTIGVVWAASSRS